MPAESPTEASLADRYYAMAEAMNTRGAMELAVPFYRQAVALLLAERQSLHQRLGSTAADGEAATLPLEELHGLLEATQAWDQHDPGSGAAAAMGATEEGLESRLAELAEDLNSNTAEQVLASLNSLGALPVEGLALRGKAQILLGQSAQAVESFEAALELAPEQPELRINTGAARLAAGDVDGAVSLLQEVYNGGLEQLEPSIGSALLRNFASAASQAGFPLEALQLRRQWQQHDPEAMPLERWLAWAQEGLAEPAGSSLQQESLALLEALAQRHPSDRSVLEQLAATYEAQGQFKEASLLYRELLRPATL